MQQPIPVQLLPYENNSGNTRTFSHLQYFNTSVGFAIRELNSTVGLPRDTFNHILGHSHVCNSCLCLFSIDGFNAHLGGVVDGKGRCLNTPSFDTGMLLRSTEGFPILMLFLFCSSHLSPFFGCRTFPSSAHLSRWPNTSPIFRVPHYTSGEGFFGVEF